MYLYKYYSFKSGNKNIKSYLIDIIQNSYLFFSPPFEFEDKTDCFINAVIKGSRKQIYNFFSNIVNDHPDNKNLSEKNKKKIISNHIEKYKSMAVNKRKTFLKHQYNWCGVLCFSKYNNLKKMWEKYADQNKGVCLQYHFKTDLNSQEKIDFIVEKDDYCYRLIEVDYQSSLPEINLIKQNSIIDILNVLSIKMEYWSFEKELRLIYFVRNNDGSFENWRKGKKVSFENKMLKKIFFGHEIDIKNKELIQDIIQKKYPDLETEDIKKNDLI